MGINSRSKGNRAEREVAALFKEWTGRPFARTPSSGGLQWKKTNVKGDIVCTKEGHYFPFCIEVKFYKDINFSHLIIPNVKSKILEFWAQCERDAKLAKKVPLLLMRYNGLPKDFYFTILPREFADKLPLNTIGRISTKTRQYGSLLIFSSHELFKLDYTKTKAIAKKHIK